MVRNAHEAARMRAYDAASALHHRLKSKDRIRNASTGQIDVFMAIEELGIPFTFQKLGKALGFCIPHPTPGIIVTTERSLHIQRYTAAHELGHIIMRHRGSVDTEILMRSAQLAERHVDIQEIEAEAFAAHFLLPSWLYIHHMRRQNWNVRQHLTNPDIVYQLSLRMNVSYEAACWGLLVNDLVPRRSDVENLLKHSPKSIKTATTTPVEKALGQADAWRLTTKDNGTTLRGSKQDLIVLELEEHASAGYLWNVDTLAHHGFDILHDGYAADVDAGGYGGTQRRRAVLETKARGFADITLRHARPWGNHAEHGNGLSLSLELFGSEEPGISRARRQKLGLAIR